MCSQYGVRYLSHGIGPAAEGKAQIHAASGPWPPLDTSASVDVPQSSGFEHDGQPRSVVAFTSTMTPMLHARMSRLIEHLPSLPDIMTPQSVIIATSILMAYLAPSPLTMNDEGPCMSTKSETSRSETSCAIIERIAQMVGASTMGVRL